ncbi:rhodanese-like domain-containing protein [Deinococcus wulumuqiensis]|uniref:rhodanese-like domain-containing protein n=1 Tax=Deinococcus wulumuqiensis TaxID=980427 RepID=UPI001CEF872E|nr:rhodanese-like domain-containing protein [Deinococcus wulumuqiensis]
MVGLDNVSGYVTSTDGLDTAQAQPLPPPSCRSMTGRWCWTCARRPIKYDEGHIPGAKQLHAGRLPWKLAELPRDQEIVVHCQGGARSAAAASFLRSQGFNVTEIAGATKPGRRRSLPSRPPEVKRPRTPDTDADGRSGAVLLSGPRHCRYGAERQASLPGSLPSSPSGKERP